MGVVGVERWVVGNDRNRTVGWLSVLDAPRDMSRWIQTCSFPTDKSIVKCLGKPHASVGIGMDLYYEVWFENHRSDIL